MPTFSVTNLSSEQKTLPAESSLTATLTATIVDETAAPAPYCTPVSWTTTAGLIDTVSPGKDC
ncbi:UNVERIFIED_ORG: hypothetical protein J2Y78_004916 [Buttiauxella agrestis ATCC 33320]